MLVKIKRFHFFSYRTAIRFHIANALLARGWEKANSSHDALLTDQHLTLNDDISKHLEYKHLLAALVEKNEPSLMPLTYCVNDQNYPQVFAKMTHLHYLMNQRYAQNTKGLRWILKPSLLNNGDGIKLFNNIEELKKYYQNPKRLGGEHVIQEYIPNPDLIEGRKYTFRLWVVLTNYAGVFAYQQGYVNISGVLFEKEGRFENRKAHITNYVLDEALSSIEQRATQTLPDFNKKYQQMCDITREVIKTLLKKAPTYLKPNKVKKMELFGFDFIADDKGKMWLLEVNQGPDAPMFEENPLKEILWVPFWKEIVEGFILPLTGVSSFQGSMLHFDQLLSQKACYSFLREGWHKIRHKG